VRRNDVLELGAESGTRVVPKGAIIFVVRGSSLDAEFRIGLTQRKVAFGQDCKALIAVREIDPAVLFVAIKSHNKEILQLVDHAGHGAGRLATDLISKVMVSVPRGHQRSAVSDILRPLVEVGARRQAENHTLCLLRDMLLPRLMSGEIRVRDAEKVVGDAI
jgi:type I restriction enzyme S subunit